MKRLLSIIIVIALMLSVSAFQTMAKDTLNMFIGKPYGQINPVYGRVYGFIGDADSDGQITILDATAIQLYNAQLTQLSEDSKLLSDIDSDTFVSVIDATEIQLWIAQLSSNQKISCVLYSDKYEAPIITRATLDKNNNVKLTWNNINGAYKYRVFVKSGSEWKAVGYTTNTAYTLKNLKNNTEYTYTVRCCNEDNKYISDYIRDNCTFTKNLVIDQEAYTEETLLYEEVIRGICNKCGKDITDDIFDTNSEYYGWDGYKYHVLVDGCQSAWHTEPHWWNILENRLATEQECNDASNPYLYNETHNDKLERRYCYTACCYVKDCEHYGNFYQEHTTEFYSSDTMNRVKDILEEHKAYHLAKGDRSDSYAGSNEQIYRIINHPEINHYELTIK